LVNVGVTGVGIVVFAFAYYRRSSRHRAAMRALGSRWVASIPRVGANPQSLVLNAAGTVAYVPALDGKSLSVVDVGELVLRRRIAVDGGALEAQPLPAEDQVLVCLTGSRGADLVIVDTAAGRVSGTVGEVVEPRGTVANWSGRSIFSASMSNDPVYRLDSRTLTVSGRG
jgi:DNA-binding beta-propeller fold protein YncE